MSTVGFRLPAVHRERSSGLQALRPRTLSVRGSARSEEQASQRREYYCCVYWSRLLHCGWEGEGCGSGSRRVWADSGCCRYWRLDKGSGATDSQGRARQSLHSDHESMAQQFGVKVVL